MTIDERLDRLVERHEALSQSVELLTKDVHEMGHRNAVVFEQMGQRIDQMAQRNAVLFDQLGEQVGSLTKNVGSLTKYVGEIAEGTARLLHVAEIHEHRITRLEGGS